MATSVLRLRLKTCKCKQLTNLNAVACRQIGTTTASSAVDYPTIQSSPAHVKRGTGGRSSFSGKVVTVFGGTGFLGRSVINQLGKIGTQVMIPYRADYHFVRHLKLCGDLGQIHFQHYYLKDEDSIRKAMEHSHAVINLIGRNFETPNFSFDDIHVRGARNIAKIARECGVKTLVHLSALGACEKPEPIILKKGSQFLASKWRGEQAVREEFPDAIIFRPSDIFGESDLFCGYYGKRTRRTGWCMSLWKKGNETFKQPVFVSDVAKGIVEAMFNSHLAGQTFQAIGPHRYQLGELVDWMQRVIGYDKDEGYIRFDSRLDLLLWIKILWAEFFFKKNRLLSWERFEKDHVTDVVDMHLPTLEDLGVELTTLESRIFYDMLIYRTYAYMDVGLENYIKPVQAAPFTTK